MDRLAGNPMPAHDAPLGCATSAALDAMVARPEDLTAPPSGPFAADAAAATLPVARRRTEGLVPLPARAASSAGL
jgi:type IV pilus biogenesis protein CpaD/CtpE